MRTIVASLLLALGLLAREARSGDFRDRVLRSRAWPPPQHRLYHNHQPARKMAPEELPKAFTWANVTGISGLEGTSLLQPSWWVGGLASSSG
jgi:hypothetical protein